jgi:hypothetical protein
MYSKPLLSAVITFLCVAYDCGTKTPESSANLRNSDVTISPTPKPVGLNDQYIQSGGWNIPLPLNRVGLKTKKVRLVNADGKSINCTVYSYVPSEDLLTDEPFKTIGFPDYGKIKITFITEMKVKDKVFSYIFLAQKTKVDNETGKLIETGPGFSYRYFDMDGDSRFETLSFHDITGNLPKWIFE